MIKYRLNFTIGAETLFGLLAKALPIEDLNVEEIVEPVAKPAKLKPVALAAPPKKRAQRLGYGVNLEEGVNGAILQALADGKPHRYSELKRAITAAGYAGNGLGSRLERLHAHKVIVRVQPGFWQKTAGDERKSA